MRLARAIDRRKDFENVLRELDKTEHILKEWRRNIDSQSKTTRNNDSNYLGVMFMALHEWRERKSSDLLNPIFKDIYDAFTKVKVDKHVICQVSYVICVVFLIRTR